MAVSQIKCFIFGFSLLATGITAAAQTPPVYPDSPATPHKDPVLQTKETTQATVKQLSILEKQVGSQVKDIGKEQVNALLEPGKKVVQLITSKINLFKPGAAVIKFNGVSADVNYNYIGGNAGLDTGLSQRSNGGLGYHIKTGLLLSNMPFDAAIRGNEGMYGFDYTPFANFGHFNFNQQKYLEQLQKSVLEKVSPTKVLGAVMSKIDGIRNQYERDLKGELRKIQSDFFTTFKKDLNIPGDITNLNIADLSSLKNRVIPESILEKYKISRERYEELMRNPGLQSALTDSVKAAALGDIKELESLQRIYEKVTVAKNKFDNNSVVKELKSHLPFTAGTFKSFLTKPGNLQQVIKDQVNLSSLQKLFMNVTKLDIGQNPLQSGELSFQQIMNTGINAEIKDKKESFGFLYGTGGGNTNTLQQTGLNSFVTNEYSKVGGFKLGSGYNSGVQQSVSLNFFDFSTSPEMLRSNNPNVQSQYLTAPNRRDAVITWKSDFAIAPNHKLSVDLSKSMGGYRNGLTEDSLMVKSNPYNQIMNNSGKSNYAAMLGYSGTVLNTALELSVKKVGLGYSNPGSVFLRKGETRIGLGVSRKIWKKVIDLKYKIDYRNQYFDPSKNNTYSNITNSLQLKFRLNRNNRFNLTYRRSDFRFNRIQQNASNGFSSNLQASGNYTIRISGKKLMNNFIVGRQHFEVPMLVGNNYVSRVLLFNHSTSVLFNKNLLTGTLALNHSDNKEYYFNTSSFTSELNYSYALTGGISLNSGLGYYSNTGWNKQLGIRQQIGGTLSQKIDFDIEVSYKKAIQIIRPELANEAYVGSSVHYRF